MGTGAFEQSAVTRWWSWVRQQWTCVLCLCSVSTIVDLWLSWKLIRDFTYVFVAILAFMGVGGLTPLIAHVGVTVCTLGMIALLHAAAPYPAATIDEREACLGKVVGMCVAEVVLAVVVWGMISVVRDAAARSAEFAFDVALAQTLLGGYLAVSVVASSVGLRAAYGVTEYRPQTAVDEAESQGPIDRVTEQYVAGEIGDHLLERKLEEAVEETYWSGSAVWSAEPPSSTSEHRERVGRGGSRP